MSVTEYRQARFSRPAGATEILLVRHGESRAASPDAPFPLVDGQGDPELHPNGRAQAERIGERLAGEPIAAVYVTNLRRTAETAQPLCRRLGLDYRIEPDLREVHLGAWEGGLLRVKAHEQDPMFLQMQREERWDVIPGAESWEQLNQRIGAALARLAAAHRDQLIAAFVHGGVVAHIMAHAAGSRPFAFAGADNGSISHIVCMDDRISIRRFNDAAHLAELEGDQRMT